MARRAAPALYELMRRPGTLGSPASPVSAGAPRRVGNAPGLPSKFEISLRSAIVIGVAVVLAISIAYGIGVKRGGSSAGSSTGGTPSESLNSNTVAPQQSSPSIPAMPGKTAGAGSTKAGSSAAGTPAAGKSAPVARVATDKKDPRVKGERYFVVAHPSSERAAEMVDFCRQNGLDAYLVPDDNALIRKIIVLPGYRDASEKSSPEMKDLEAKIKSVGDKWKRSSRGNKDFADAYPELYR